MAVNSVRELLSWAARAITGSYKQSVPLKINPNNYTCHITQEIFELWCSENVSDLFIISIPQIE